jgi:hypothetical protein
MPQRQNPMDSFFQAFMMGQQMKAQRDAMEMEKQDRALKIEALQQEAKRLKLQDKMQAFNMLKGQRGPMTEQPGEEIPALFSPGGQMGVQGPPQMVEGQHPEFDFSELQPGLTMRPQNMGDLVREQIAQRQREMALKGQELEQEQSIKAQFANPMQSVEAPGVGPVSAPSNVLPNLLQIIAQEREKQAGREFTSGENARDRASRESLAAAGRSHDFALESHKAKLRPSESEKPLSAEAASRLAVVDTADSLAGKLKKELKGAGRLKLAGIYAGTNSNVNRLIDDLIDADIRIRTGAAASKDEVKARRSQIIRAMDVATGDTGPMMDAIQRMQDEARAVSGNIRPKKAGAAPGAPTVRRYNPATGRLE